MKQFAFLILLFIYSIASGQGEANNWIFGYGSGVKFSQSDPSTITSSSQIKLNTQEGCSSFSDTNGNLIFYSDGNRVWDANHNIMPNGRNLKGNSSSTQSAMIIPKPLSSTEYYIFTVGANFNASEPGFNYYTIDMTQNGGLGDIVAGPIDLSGGLSGSWTEKVAAVEGAECNTFWVISYDGNSLKSYKVSSTGVETTPVISRAPPPEYDRRGYLKVSPDGKKVAIAHYLYFGFNNDGSEIPGGDSSVILYDFDDITGVISNGTRLFDDRRNDIHPYGLEFSRESTKLYTSTFDGLRNAVYQYDLESSDIKSSETFIHTQRGYRGALQLAPDGKIYATVSVDYYTGTNSLDVINNPNELGINCGYQEDYLQLGSGQATQGLPPFIASIFSPIDISGDNGDGNPQILNGQKLDLCIGESFIINPEPISGKVTYEWTFNDTVVSTTEKLILNNISLADIGNYNLEVTSIDSCGRLSFRNGNFIVNSVNDPPIAYSVATQIICDDAYDGTYEFDFNTLFSTIILNGQDPTVFEVKYFASQIDADLNSNELPTPHDSANATIFARIQNRNNNNCYDTTNFDIEIYESPLPLESLSITNLSSCDDTSVGTDTDGITIFDLEERELEILNGQASLDFTLNYFTDLGYSNKITDPTLFENTVSGEQTIYVRMTNNSNINCFKDTSFKVEVYELPVIQSSMVFKNCDEDGNPDGFTDYNLEQANDYITNNNDELTVTYHLSIGDASAGSNEINPVPFNNAAAGIVFARIETAEGCYRVSTIDLQVSTTAFPLGYLQELQTCDDDNTIDGLHLFDLSQASAAMIAQFPTGQNLTVHYFRDLNDAQLEQNEIIDQTNYFSEIPFNQILFVRVESNDNGECFGLGPYLDLRTFERPEFEVVPTMSICINLPPVLLEVFNPKGTYTYIWTDQNNNTISTEASAEITNGGVYTVVASSTDGNSCSSFPQTVTVIDSNIASIDLNDITIKDDSTNNTITINSDNNNLGIGDYEFSLDQEYGAYQDESFFDMVIPGIHTIYIKDKNNCGTVSIEVSVIGFPKFFSPNNDGKNDNWQVLGVSQDFYPTSLIYIFDRFGKVVAKINPVSTGWNGLYNGTLSPSDDYWFSVELIDENGNSKQRKGHFSLIRR
jgi:gliding motility-associated-like protein